MRRKCCVLLCLLAACQSPESNLKEPTSSPEESAPLPPTRTLTGRAAGIVEAVTLSDGTRQIVITANGAFSFPTSDASAPYRLSITASPVQQVCTLQNGSGERTGVIDDIVLTCETKTFPLDVTVSGLKGEARLRETLSGLEVAATQDGAYHLAEAIPYGSAYDVVLAAQPVRQRCAVTNASGVASGALQAVLLSCEDRAWHSPADLTAHNSVGTGQTREVVAASNARGDLVIAWIEDSTSYQRVFIAQADAGGEWTWPSSDQDAISPTAPGAAASDLSATMNASGDVLVTWMQWGDGSIRRAYKSERTGGVWVHPSSAGDSYSLTGTSVAPGQLVSALADNGDAMVVWGQPAPTNMGLFGLERRNATWAAVPPSNARIGVQGEAASDPAVAIGPSGDTIVAWTQKDDAGKAQVFMLEYHAGSWTFPTGLADNVSPDGSPAAHPAVAVSAEGNAVLAWIQSVVATGRQVLLVSERQNGVWHHPTSVGEAMAPTGTSVSNPVVSMNAAGDVLLAWTQYEATDTSKRVWARLRQQGQWSGPATLASGFLSPNEESPGLLYGDAYALSAQIDARGDARLVYLQDDGAGKIIAMRAELINGTWHAATRTDDAAYVVSLPGDATLDASAVSLSAPSSSTALIGFIQYDGTLPRLYITRFF